MSGNQKFERFVNELDVYRFFSLGFSQQITSIAVASKPSAIRTIWSSFSSVNTSSDYLFAQEHRSKLVSFYSTLNYATNNHVINIDRIRLLSQFLHYYRLFSKKDILLEIDIKAVVIAHSFTCELFPGDENMFSLNGAWYVARDLRSNVLWEKNCRNCKTSYVVIEDNSCSTIRCPYCSNH